MRRARSAFALAFAVAACGIDVVGIAPNVSDAGRDAHPVAVLPDPSSSGGTSGTSGTDARAPIDAAADAPVADFDTGSGCTNVKRMTSDTFLAKKAMPAPIMTVDGDPKEWPCEWRVKFRGTPDGFANGLTTTSAAEASLAWTDMGLFVMAYVATNRAPAGSDPEPFRNDAAEIYVAKDPRGAIKAEDVHLTVGYDATAKWYPNGTDQGQNLPGGVLTAAMRFDNHFVVEMFIPKDVLHVGMKNDDVYNFEIQIDEPTRAGVGRPAFWIVRTQQDDGTCGEPHCSSNMWGKVKLTDP